jgi:hypothetical protein
MNLIYLFSIKVPNIISLWCEGDYFIDTTNKAGFDNGNNIYCHHDRWYLYDSAKKTYRTRNFDIDIDIDIEIFKTNLTINSLILLIKQLNQH